MSKLKRLFTDIDMTWLRVILFAIITGVYTGLINQVPFLHDTSFLDIAVTMEWWLLFAMIIACNAKTAKESALKIFVFFMISQPVVFLVELPMIGFDAALRYYRAWFLRILLTLPGGYFAYYAKQESIFGTVILSFATGLLAALGYSYFQSCMLSFPHHLLTVLFCIAQALVYLFVLKKKTLHRIILACITIGVLIFFMISSMNMMNTQGIGLPEGEWTCITEFTDGSTGEMQGTMYAYKYNTQRFVDKEIQFQNAEGEIITYQAYKDENGSIWIKPKE